MDENDNLTIIPNLVADSDDVFGSHLEMKFKVPNEIPFAYFHKYFYYPLGPRTIAFPTKIKKSVVFFAKRINGFVDFESWNS